MTAGDDFDVEQTLSALGEWLAHDDGEPFGIVVLGGTALLLMGIVERGTNDVDLLALNPSKRELSRAEKWVRAQDPSPTFQAILNQVLEALDARLG